MTNEHHLYSVVPGSGAGEEHWREMGAIPESYSMGGWTHGNEGFAQQTFLGASIRNWSVNGGFGDSSSSLSISLVNDEYNVSDRQPMGFGDDVYHNGTHDKFSPPAVGTPVWFKFGKNLATVEQAWRKVFDDMYINPATGKNYDTLPPEPDPDYIITAPPHNIPDHGWVLNKMISSDKWEWVDKSHFYKSDYEGRGKYHFSFGGILQSYTQNRGGGGSPVYEVQVADPREILSNSMLILSDYAGTTFNNANMFNIFGFLEYEPTEATINFLKTTYGNATRLGRFVGEDGTVVYAPGDIATGFQIPPRVNGYPVTDMWYENTNIGLGTSFPAIFPVTGTGMSRRSSTGMPIYRIIQAMDALFQYNGILPPEYAARGFGGVINFRGFNYVVDWSGIPTSLLPDLYSIDFNQIDMLSLAQEICDIISHDLFVSLLPVIDHPAVEFLHNYNKLQFDARKMVHGIIRLDAINRSKAPSYGAIKSFIDSLDAKGVTVENSDVGFELSNITTDKFVVGAQQTEMYYFSAANDKDHLEYRKLKSGMPNRVEKLLGEQWEIPTQLTQQLIPFYGFIGKDAVVPPRGFGAYQQILLDATALEANGVGNYYIATEMELRAALVSYKRWSDFLLTYNDVYLESMEENDMIESQMILNTANTDPNGIPHDPEISNNYGVAVPRCVWLSDKNWMGDDNLPASPCSPPFGYPLYYKRAMKIGIPQAGVAKIQAAKTAMTTNYTKLKKHQREQEEYVEKTQDELKDAYTHTEPVTGANSIGGMLGGMWEYATKIIERGNEAAEAIGKLEEIEDQVGLITEFVDNNCDLISSVQRIGKKTMENSMKVYNFVKSVADKHLGKTYLVKMPKRTNTKYAHTVTLRGRAGKSVVEVEYGPFGFKPQPINPEVGYYYGQEFQTFIAGVRAAEYSGREGYLSLGTKGAYTHGALKCNYNPMSDQYEFNYAPDPQGGFFEFELASNVMSPAEVPRNPKKWPRAMQNMLAPIDLTNFIDSNGRVSCYARFDNAQWLDFHGVGKQSISQQVISYNGRIIPDITMELDNMRPDKSTSMKAPKDIWSKPKSVAFLKCSLDSNFYMAPKMQEYRPKIYGRNVKDIGAYVAPRKIWVPSGCFFADSYTYYQAHWVPDKDGGYGGAGVAWIDFVRSAGNKNVTKTSSATTVSSNKKGVTNVINTSKAALNPDTVYALITLPSRIKPTIDSRGKDGPYQSFQGVLQSHYQTRDTVKGVRAFNKPGLRGTPTNFLGSGCGTFNTDTIVNAFEAYKKSMSVLTTASPEKNMHFTAPSPVMPDMVAIPLQSKERCYGPWVSSALDAQAANLAGIGGKVEFIKDENLAPWNYAGFQLMNEAGRTQALFSNSLQLFTERGGFVFPDAPEGNTLAAPLIEGGPLVTSISVDVSDGGVKTTYKMDLYTPSFGKLHKQKEMAISQVARERQRLRDERNALIRKGLGKAQTSMNYGNVFSQFDNLVELSTQGSEFVSSLQTGNTYSDTFVAQASSQESKGYRMQNGSPDPIHRVKYGASVSMQPSKIVQETMGMFADNDQAREAYYKSAGGNLSSMYLPVDNSPREDDAMASVQYEHYAAKQRRFYEDVEILPLDDNVVVQGGATSTPSTGSGTASDDDNAGDGMGDGGAGADGGMDGSDGGDYGGGSDSGDGSGGGAGGGAGGGDSPAAGG